MPLLCRICFDTSKQPQSTRCGHIFCAGCLATWIENERKAGREESCPTCRTAISSTDLVPIFDTGDGLGGENGDGAATMDGRKDSFRVHSMLHALSAAWDSSALERQSLERKMNEVLVRNAELEKVVAEQKAAIDELKRQNAALQTRLGDDGRGTSTVEESEQKKDTGGVVIEEPPSPIKVAAVEEPFRLIKSHRHHDAPVHGIAAHPTEPWVATSSWDTTCKLYDLREERVLRVFQHDMGLYAAEFSRADATLLGTCSSDGSARLWNVFTGERLQTLQGHRDEVNNLSFHWSKNVLATVSDDTTCLIFDIEDGSAVMSLRGHQSAVYGVCFQPGGDLVGTASFDLTARLWDCRTGAPVRDLQGHTDDVIGIDIDENSSMIATGSDDKTCRIWDMRTWQCIHDLKAHSGEVKRVHFSPYSRLLATASGDTTVRVWSTVDFRCTSILEGHEDHVFDAAWSPSLDWIVTASHDHTWALHGSQAFDGSFEFT